jgi:hypothetical protein
MTAFDRTRRRFLASTAVAGFGAAGLSLLAGIRSARAFSQQPMNAAEHKAYLAACSAAADPYHAALVRQAEDDLKGQLSEAEIQRKIAAMRCPICGCALVAATPSSPGADRAG